MNRTDIIRELLSIVNSNLHELSIAGYINTWLSIAKLQSPLGPLNDYEQTIQILKEVLFKNQAWGINDLEPFEVINIIICMATLKENDLEFLKELVNYLDPKLKILDKNDLINLARVALIYLKQYNEFYVKIHNECVDRINEFTSQEKNILKETFTKSKAYLPSSPFIYSALD